MIGPSPPRFARWLLVRVLPPRDRESLPGEMDEMYAARAEERGRRAADRWYRRQAAAFAVRIAFHALSRRLDGLREGFSTGDTSMDAIARDTKHAVRALLRRPGFTAVAVLSLALGIGANTAIFSLVDSLLLRELPVEAPERWVELYTADSGGFEYATFSYPDVRDVREQGSHVFDEVVSYEIFLAPRQTEGGSRLVSGELVSPNYFRAVRARPAVGRLLATGDDPGAAAATTVVLIHAYWQREFGADPGVVGRTVRLKGHPFEVVGVVAPDFSGMYPGIVPAAWLPEGAAGLLEEDSGPSRLERRGHRSVFVKARLAEGVGVERARAWLADFSRRLGEVHPETNADRAMTLVPSSDVSFHPAVDRALVPVAGLLLGVVGLVLLIACVNLASFLLARAEDRRREVAVRLAMGAGRASLVRRMLVETVLLALAGGAAGLVLARWTLDLLVRYRPPVPVPIQVQVEMDGSVLLFTAVVSVAAGLFFGLLPALKATRLDVAPVLKGESGGVAGRRGFGLRGWLVVTQVAFSFLLLVGAGLFSRSLSKAQRIDPGFYTGSAAILWPELEMSGMEESAEWATFWRLLEERLEARPEVEAVAMTDVLPLGLGMQTRPLDVPGVPSEADDGFHHVDFALVSPDWFDAMEVPVRRGRAFDVGDGPDDARVAVVSEAFVARMWPGADPVGRTLYLKGGDPVTVVGVAADTKVRTLGEDPRPRIYFPTTQEPGPGLNVVVRGRAPGEELLRVARETADELRPDVVYMEAKTMEEHLAVMLFPPRMAALLLGVFGGLALLLSAVGIYGVVSYAVARRTKEVGIRVSLGATPGSVVRQVVGKGMRLVGVGAAAGLVLAALGGSLVSRFLYGVDGADLATFVSIPTVLVAVAFVAAWIPARRASRVDPVTALRAE